MAGWTVCMKKADFQVMGERFKINPVLSRIMRNRDLITDEDYRKFLHGTMADLYCPTDMKDMQKAADIVLQKIRERAKIRIIGDYDVDGVCSTYILENGLRSMGADVDSVIPHRIKDGYGLNADLIEEAISDEIDTIITCDNGIAAKLPIERAKEAGMTVVITDHHEVPFVEDESGHREYIIPDADAVVDPKQEDCEYPFPGICGALVAYKLIQCMYETLGMDRLSECFCQNPLYEKKWIEEKPETIGDVLKTIGILEFAALATICDVMELKDENRIVVKEGLKAVRETQNLGLKALLEVSELQDKEITVYHAGFILGPCINATGRLDTAERGLELFRAKSYREAMVIAAELKSMNESRKAMTLKGLDEAVAVVEKEKLNQDSVLVVFLPDCHESLAGIIAGRLREKYGKPAIVLTRGEEGVKGSARSIEAYHMYEKLCECRELLTKFGGHKLAAGLSLREEDILPLRQELNARAGLKPENFEEKVLIDVPMPMSYVTEEFVEELSILEPFGTGNPKPVFAQKDLTFVSGRRLGANQNVGKYMVHDAEGNSFEVMLFDNLPGFDSYLTQQFGLEEMEALYRGGAKKIRLMVTYYPDINEFRGRVSLQFIMKHYKA